jgi:hypothetical protein
MRPQFARELQKVFARGSKAARVNLLPLSIEQRQLRLLLGQVEANEQWRVLGRRT